MEELLTEQRAIQSQLCELKALVTGGLEELQRVAVAVHQRDQQASRGWAGVGLAT